MVCLRGHRERQSNDQGLLPEGLLCASSPALPACPREGDVGCPALQSTWRGGRGHLHGCSRPLPAPGLPVGPSWPAAQIQPADLASSLRASASPSENKVRDQIISNFPRTRLLSPLNALQSLVRECDPLEGSEVWIGAPHRARGGRRAGMATLQPSSLRAPACEVSQNEVHSR